MSGNPGPGLDPLCAAVREAWQAAAPGGSFDPEGSWAETGADSLETMNLVLRLERSLGRRIPLDLVTPETTPRTLALALARGAATREEGGNPLFLIPGLLGDEPVLAAFRRALGSELSLETLRLPDLDSPVATLADLRAIGRCVADEAERRRPEGAILIAGYSFGANVAYEAASALLERGRKVGFVGLLDPVPPEADGSSGHGRPWAMRDRTLRLIVRRIRGAQGLLSARGESAASYAGWLAILLLIRLRAIDAARRAALAARPHPVRFRRRRLQVMLRMRADALRRWRPKPLHARTLLVAGNSFAGHPGSEAWRALLPNRKELRLAVPHLDLLKPGTLEPLAADFQSAVREALLAEG